jgi:glycerol dehydrogenase-like iron-containing ADH family enzyme
MTIDEKVRARFDELVTAGEAVVAGKWQAQNRQSYVDLAAAHQWATSSMSLIEQILGIEGAHARQFRSLVQKVAVAGMAMAALGTLRAARDDYASGLHAIHRLVEAEVFDGLLEQAEHLLANGYHVAAAVIAGAVLEDTLRNLCQQHGIVLLPNATAGAMNDALAGKVVYNKLVQKQVTTQSHVRNKAAHGELQQFTREDVAEMVPWVRRFVSEKVAP